jgi:hypothetical protein
VLFVLEVVVFDVVFVVGTVVLAVGVGVGVGVGTTGMFVGVMG